MEDVFRCRQKWLSTLKNINVRRKRRSECRSSSWEGERERDPGWKHRGWPQEEAGSIQPLWWTDRQRCTNAVMAWWLLTMTSHSTSLLQTFISSLWAGLLTSTYFSSLSHIQQSVICKYNEVTLLPYSKWSNAFPFHLKRTKSPFRGKKPGGKKKSPIQSCVI